MQFIPQKENSFTINRKQCCGKNHSTPLFNIFISSAESIRDYQFLKIIPLLIAREIRKSFCPARTIGQISQKGRSRRLIFRNKIRIKMLIIAALNRFSHHHLRRADKREKAFWKCSKVRNLRNSHFQKMIIFCH